MDWKNDDLDVCVHESFDIQHASPTVQVWLNKLHKNFITFAVKHVFTCLRIVPHCKRSYWVIS